MFLFFFIFACSYSVANNPKNITINISFPWAFKKCIVSLKTFQGSLPNGSCRKCSEWEELLNRSSCCATRFSSRKQPFPCNFRLLFDHRNDGIYLFYCFFICASKEMLAKPRRNPFAKTTTLQCKRGIAPLISCISYSAIGRKP